jgi:hypothetical protein
VLRAALACVSLLVCACSTQRAYDAARVPESATALIRPARQLARQVLIRAIDGRPLGWLRDRARVSPGAHRIEVTVVFDTPGGAASATHALSIDARPGAEYAVYAEWAWYGPAAVLRDVRTRARIAAAEPRPPVGAGPRARTH